MEKPDRAIEIRHRLEPGDLGMVIHLHGVLYAREYGLDTTFEPYVAKPLAEFAMSGEGRLWIAAEGGHVVGSVSAGACWKRRSTMPARGTSRVSSSGPSPTSATPCASTSARASK